MVEYIFIHINNVKYSILHIENQDIHIRGTIRTRDFKLFLFKTFMSQFYKL
jgi:hypothetical protein